MCDPSTLGLERCTLGQGGRPALTERTRCATHEAEHQRRRNADPRRVELYQGDWPAHRRARIAEVGSCIEADATCRGPLSVDHPTDDVLCTSHHSRREARRRAQAKAAAG